MIEETLTTLLRDVTPRVHPLLAPDNSAAPFIIYTRASTQRLRDMDGLTGIALPMFRVDVYALTFLAVRELARDVRRALDGYSDMEVMTVDLDQERDLSDLTSDPKLFRVQLDFRIIHREQ